MIGGRAVQIGAGNIGRGFLGQIFHESGLEVVFIDINQQLIAAFNEQRRYNIDIVGAGARQICIDNVRAVDVRDVEKVSREIAEASVVATAVGASTLPKIAPLLADALMERFRTEALPLNIIVCENLHDAAVYLRSLVGAALSDDLRQEIFERTGFVQAVVSRMVPIRTAQEQRDDPLGIRVEAYKRLPVDVEALVAPVPKLLGMEPVINFAAYEARKLFTHNCAHATLGYLGALRGIEFGYAALQDGEIAAVLRDVLNESGEALICEYGLERAEHEAHTRDLLERFANKELGDTCFRLARDPLRKLAPEDRLIGAARLCERHNIKPVALAYVIAAALCFAAPDDPAAAELQASIARDSVAQTLEMLCGVKAEEALGKQIISAYRLLKDNKGVSIKERQQTKVGNM